MSQSHDPAQQAWQDAWDQAHDGGFARELRGALQTERMRLKEESEEGDRTFERPLGRQDCIHGLYFEGVFDRAVEAARLASGQSE